MWESFQQNPLLFVLLGALFVPFVYFTSRAIFLAYFHAKRDHLRRLYQHAADQKQD